MTPDSRDYWQHDFATTFWRVASPVLAKLEIIMSSYKLRSTVCFAGLLVAAGAMILQPDVARADEGDLVDRVSNALPAGWSVDISSFEGKCFVNITTAVMETNPSRYRQGRPDMNKRARLVVSLTILPRYTTTMLERIKSHNKPLRDRIKALGGHLYSPQQSELESKLIEEPKFYDSNYGFRVNYPLRVPAKPEDADELVRVFGTISRDWKSYDADKPDVLAELRRILTR